MPIPVLKVDLAPPPSLWQRHHQALGWIFLGAGSLALATAVTLSWMAYREAHAEGRSVILRTDEAREVVRKQKAIEERLRAIDVAKDLPAWRLAERILSERSLPWSRLTAELERSLVQDVRLKSVQRIRNASRSVEVKVEGEARSRAAEETFIGSLRENACFAQVILEREFERQGGGLEFELVLPVVPLPPPYEPLPKYGPARKVTPVGAQQAALSVPLRAGARPERFSKGAERGKEP